MQTVRDATLILSVCLRAAALTGTVNDTRAAAIALDNALAACPNDDERDVLFSIASKMFRHNAAHAGLEDWRASWQRILSRRD